VDREKQIGEIANRLRQAREGLGVTQTEFADQISISRDRLATAEDGRSVLRCDVALRACRQFFISEFWLATGAINEKEAKAGHRTDFGNRDARLTMALAVEQAALACPPGCSFADGFDPYLRRAYCQLAGEQKGLPRVAPLPSDGPDYPKNAINCLILFWHSELSPDQWEKFFPALVASGQSTFAEIKDK